MATRARANEPIDLTAPDSSGLPPLHLAACDGKHKRVDELIALGAPLDLCLGNYGTPLFQAIRRRQRAIVERLIRAGADVDRFEGASSRSPMLCALSNGDVAVSEMMFGAGAKLDLERALESAASGGSVHLIEAVVARGAKLSTADHGAKALSNAVSSRQPKAVRALVQLGARIDPGRDEGVLVDATCCSMHAAIPDLLAAGADPNKQASWLSPLTGSTSDPKALRALLAAGARVDDRANAKDETALHVAARLGRGEAVKILLQAGADPSLRTNEGLAARDLAEKHGRKGAYALLSKAGDPPLADEKVKEDRPEILEAVYEGDLKIARKLLRDKRLLAMRDPFFADATLLGVAARERHTDLVKHLLQAGVDPNGPDSAGRTPLFWTIAEEDEAEKAAAMLRCVRLLLAAGARPDVPDRDGQTPRTIAKAVGNKRVIAALDAVRPKD